MEKLTYYDIINCQNCGRPLPYGQFDICEGGSCLDELDRLGGNEKELRRKQLTIPERRATEV